MGRDVKNNTPRFEGHVSLIVLAMLISRRCRYNSRICGDVVSIGLQD